MVVNPLGIGWDEALRKRRRAEELERQLTELERQLTELECQLARYDKIYKQLDEAREAARECFVHWRHVAAMAELRADVRERYPWLEEGK